MKSKKELKAAYKEMKPQMGVFQIKNQANGKVFIDGAINMEAKWNRHRSELRFGGHRNRDLQQDWNKQEEDTFIFEVLSELTYNESGIVDYKKEVEVLMEMYKEELMPYEEKGYNKKKRK